MIVKIFRKHGSGKASSCKACVDYLLNKPNNHAQVLQGDPRLSQDIADSLDFTNTYTAGCLSFEEKDLPEQQKREIMQRFEQTFFSGLDPEQYNIAWVQHTDKGRLELNFVIPNVELTTGKRLQPYYDKADRPLAENFKQVINHEYGLTDPNSPEKKQTLITKGNLPKEKKQALNAINSGLESLIRAGKINNREDVINALQNAGFEIARITPKNISIKTDGQNLRLKGAYYEQSFRYGDSLSETIRENARKYERDSSERYQTARNRLKTAITARKQQFKQRYPSRAKEIDQGYRKSVEISDPNTIRPNGDNADSIGRFSVVQQADLSRVTGMAKLNGSSQRSNQWNQTINLQDQRRIKTLRSDRHGLSGDVGRELQNSEIVRTEKQENQLGGENGDRNRTAFRERIENLVRTASGRINHFISKVRQFGAGEPRDPHAIQANQRAISDLNRLNQHLKPLVEQKLRNRNKEMSL